MFRTAVGFFCKCSQKTLVFLVSLYRYFISPFLGIGHCCRFHPSCSEYALIAIQRLPLCRGLSLICWRLLRCHPFCLGGYDPVPLSLANEKK